MAARGGEAMLVLVSLGAALLVVLALAAWLAGRSRRPSQSRPRRKTFEAGRRAAHARGARTTRAALDELGHAPAVRVLAASADDDGVRATLERKPSQPCAQVAGFLTGLFEAAWAHEVTIVHTSCAGPKGGECRYEVRRAVIRRGAPAGGASTPGSAAAPRRSPRAPAGGG